jgi:hypothetical protein
MECRSEERESGAEGVRWSEMVRVRERVCV